MPILKNPFKSKGLATTNDSTGDATTGTLKHDADRTESPARLSIQKPRMPEPDYKLSSVSPEGTFIPPSPPEKTSFLSRFRHTGNLAQDKALTADENSGFVIPRESFDTYRRSFDIRPSMDGTGSLNEGRPSRSSLDLLTATGTASPRRPSQITNVLHLPDISKNVQGSTGKNEHVLFPPLIGEVVGPEDDRGFEEIKLDQENPMKKKHFWQKSSNLSAGLRKERNEENELKPIRVNETSTNAGADRADATAQIESLDK